MPGKLPATRAFYVFSLLDSLDLDYNSLMLEGNRLLGWNPFRKPRSANFSIIYNIFTSREHRTSHHAPTMHASHLTSQKCCHLTGLNIGQPSAYSKTRLNRLNLYTVRGNVSYCTFCKLSGEGILWISFRFSCNLRHFFLLAIYCMSFQTTSIGKGLVPAYTAPMIMTTVQYGSLRDLHAIL